MGVVKETINPGDGSSFPQEGDKLSMHYLLSTCYFSVTYCECELRVEAANPDHNQWSRLKPLDCWFVEAAASGVTEPSHLIQFFLFHAAVELWRNRVKNSIPATIEVVRFSSPWELAWLSVYVPSK